MFLLHPLTITAFIVLLIAVCIPAEAQRTLNHGVHAVPAAGKVVINGDLSEWDTSGAITCCKDVESMIDSESAQVAAMWDADNLYLGISWRDKTPMFNNVDPVTMPGNGWRSDCVQFRFDMNGFVSHVDAWYYTPGKLPAMSIHYGRMGVEDGGQPKVDRPAPMKMGVEQVFKLSADGKGYTQEIKIPWAVLTLDGKMPPKGADLRMGLELFWGDIAGDGWPRSRVTDNLYDGETQTDFFWTNVKGWGRLILEEKGKLQLPTPSWLRAKPVEPQGPVPISFTLDKDAYITIAIEDADGNRVKSLVGGVKYPKGKNTITWSGLDDRDNILPAGTYHWVGICRDELNVSWKMDFYQPNKEKPWPNAMGTGAWGPDHGTLLTAATGGGRVYLAGIGSEGGYPFFACDENGKKLWSSKSGEPDHLAYADGIIYGYTSSKDSNWLGITPRGVMQFDAATGRWLDITKDDGSVTRRLDLLTKDESSVGFAADKKNVYLSIKDKGIIRSFDRKTFKAGKSFTVADAGEIFSASDDSLLVVTPKALYKQQINGLLIKLAENDFSTARGITADAKGHIYITLGEPHHQVLVYQLSNAHAKLVKTIGKAGGRTLNGWYKPEEGFSNPTGMAVDGSGKLWVVEESYKPKRVSVWKNNKWMRDYIGDTFYGGGGVINPLDPTMAFYKDMQFKINLDSGKWSLRQIGMEMPKNAADFDITYSREKPEGFTGYIVVHKNTAYLINDKPRQIFRQRKDGRWVLCVHLDLEKKFVWIDKNDDGIVQEDEITRGEKDDNWGSMDYWGQRPSVNMDMYFANGNHGFCYRLQGVTKAGTPLYDFNKPDIMAGECQNGIGLRDGSYNSGCSGERGEYFSEMRKIYPAGDNRRTFWFRGLNTGRWTYRLPEPGVVLYPYQAHGTAVVPSLNGEIICWVSDFGQRYLFTDDMLYVGQLFMDGRSNWDGWPDSPKPGFIADKMAPGQETFMGYFARLNDGKYIVSTGSTDCRIFQINGIDSLKRLPGGTLTLRQEDLARANEIRQFRTTGGITGAAITTIQNTAKPVIAAGNADIWGDPIARIKVDDQRNARVFGKYDQTNLYIAWDVNDVSPMKNIARRWQLAFKGGDAVDLMFRLPAGKQEDAAIHAGDMRLLITQFEGKTTAVLYRPISTVKQPENFDAFEGAGRDNTVRMDEVRLATEVTAKITTRADGYLVEAVIPWSLIGATPKADSTYRADFGVLFSDPTGQTTAVRSYWSNKDTNIVVDIPTEAKLQPGNWGSVKLK